MIEHPHQYPSSKDIDNMIKFIMDALHGITYANDICVVRLTATKAFVNGIDDSPYTKVQLNLLK
jgi:Holliday junction resolvase RusA-like endonuclease